MNRDLIYIYEDDWERYWKEKGQERLLLTRQMIVFWIIIYGGSVVLGSLSIIVGFLFGLPISLEAWFVITSCSMLGGLIFLFIEKVKISIDKFFDTWNSIRIVSRPSSGDYHVGGRHSKQNSLGFLYVMRSPSCSLYKLGRSKNPKRRLSKLKKQMPPFDWEIIHLIRTDDYIKAEAGLLKMFNHKKAGRNEYFDLDIGDIALIKSLSVCDLSGCGEIEHLEMGGY